MSVKSCLAAGAGEMWRGGEGTEWGWRTAATGCGLRRETDKGRCEMFLIMVKPSVCLLLLIKVSIYSRVRLAYLMSRPTFHCKSPASYNSIPASSSAPLPPSPSYTLAHTNIPLPPGSLLVSGAAFSQRGHSSPYWKHSGGETLSSSVDSPPLLI